MLASVLVGMLSIPAASQSIDLSKPVVSDVDNISNSGQNPRTVEKSVGPETYEKTVQTAFEKFQTTISGDSSEVVRSNPDREVRIETAPGVRTFSLETPSGSIEKTYASGKITEKVSTPNGVLVQEQQHGTTSVDFEGSNRKKVEQTAQELRDRLQTQVEKLRQRSNTSSSTADYSVSVEVQPEGNESISITSEDAVDLEGWNVTDESGNTYTFHNRTLGSGETVTLYSGDGIDNETAVYWGSSRIWNDAGDTAYIYDSTGEKVVEKSY